MVEDISYSEDNFENVFLVGVKVEPGAHQIDLYALVLYNEVARADRNRPLTSNGRILFFRDAGHADQVLGMGDVAFRKYRPFGAPVAYVYDVPRVLAIVANEMRDEPGMVADFINELLDFVAATGAPFPDRYREALFRLADATTFDKNFSSLFASSPETRATTLDALYWCLGLVLAHATIF
jgi:hypothetical protein